MAELTCKRDAVRKELVRRMRKERERERKKLKKEDEGGGEQRCTTSRASRTPSSCVAARPRSGGAAPGRCGSFGAWVAAGARGPGRLGPRTVRSPPRRSRGRRRAGVHSGASQCTSTSSWLVLTSRGPPHCPIGLGGLRGECSARRSRRRALATRGACGAHGGGLTVLYWMSRLFARCVGRHRDQTSTQPGGGRGREAWVWWWEACVYARVCV